MNSFAVSPEGDLFLADGLGSVRRWPGAGSAFVDAGVPPGTNTPTLGGSGSGRIFGPLYGYYRLLDDAGNPGNVSPVSLAHESDNSTAAITAATNATPVVITSAGHGLSNGNWVVIEGVAGNLSANGFFTVGSVSTDTFALLELDGATNVAGSGAYVSGGTWRKGRGTLTYGNLPTSYPDARAVRIQLLRTKDGDATVAYVDYDSTTLPGATHASTKHDDQLGDAVVLIGINNEDAASDYYTEPPEDKPFLAFANGRMVYAGDPVYDTGSVGVTNASTSVTGHGTAWTSDLIGRYLHVPGGPKAYLVSNINTSTQVITLSENYTGSTVVATRYALRPAAANRRTILWSAAGLSDAVSPLNALTLHENPDAGEVTGLVAHQRWVYAFCEHRKYRFSFQDDPALDGYVADVSGRGCVNNHCWCVVEGTVYALDRQGVYTFDGADDNPLSAPIQKMFDPESDAPYRIRWSREKEFHCVHDPENATVLFFVSLTGGRPRHALAYRYRAKQWDIVEYPVPVTASCLGALGGRRQVYLGSDAREILAANVGFTDGTADRATHRGSVTSAGLTWLADSTQYWPADSAGCRLSIVSGKGKGQWRRVTEVDGTKLHVDAPWTSKPDTTSEYQLGGIAWRLKTGWKDWATSDSQVPRGLSLTYKPLEREARFDARVYEDRADDPNEMAVTTPGSSLYGIGSTEGSPDLDVTTTKTNGRAKYPLPATSETSSDGARSVAVEVVGETNAERQVLYGLTIEGARE